MSAIELAGSAAGPFRIPRIAMPRVRTFVWTALAVALVDGATKWAALVSLGVWSTPGGGLGPFRLAVAYNPSGPMGMMPAGWTYVVAASLLLGALGFALWRTHALDAARAAALALMAGGTAANLLNYFVDAGGSVDFLGTPIGGGVWAVFNIADVFIVAGMAIHVALAWRRDADAPWWRRGLARLA